jgi:hypothetical protein
MGKVILSVEGNDGQLELLADRVVINRKGLWCALKYGLNAKREIPLGAISEVTFRAASLQLGEIEFVRSGVMRQNTGKNNDGAVHFSRKKNKEMEHFKEKVFELLNVINANRQK